jgi:hypothetical protein
MTDVSPVEHDYQTASTRTLVFTFTFVGFVLALLVWMAVTNMPEQSADEWVANAAVVEQGLEDLYVEDVTVIRDVSFTGRTTSRDETILVDGEEVDCILFDDATLDLRCKTDDGILPLTPEPNTSQENQ